MIKRHAFLLDHVYFKINRSGLAKSIEQKNIVFSKIFNMKPLTTFITLFIRCYVQKKMAMSLEIIPLAALYPPPLMYFLNGYNRKGRKCPRHEHTAPGDH